MKNLINLLSWTYSKENKLIVIILVLAVLLACLIGAFAPLPANTKLKMIRPFIESEYPEWKITGKFYDLRPTGGDGKRGHNAIDYSMPTGTSVIAPADGKIILSKYVRGYGNVIYLDHGNGLVSILAHLSEYRKLIGSEVKKGEILAFSGDTGNSQGRPHLHWAVHLNNVPVHPSQFIF